MVVFLELWGFLCLLAAPMLLVLAGNALLAGLAFVSFIVAWTGADICLQLRKLNATVGKLGVRASGPADF
jgi:hypothetical protein